MKAQTKKDRNIIRFATGGVTLLILASFIYKWNNGLNIDIPERLGLGIALVAFVTTFMPQRKKDAN
ncbi:MULTISPECIES: hypothetical protein [Bacillus cereus group]|uniref:hypothetical protein n=1 Tax=Bacillus cereus group TaxID=86661 RepID=UPI000BEC7EB1|nr:hypothetical protein [Bacillus cereus]PDY78264.1 hypothetical protein CON06_26135 [Bacillus cereus]PFA11397.1 hypothetical protein CN382_19690 [Bacillus cereus]PGL58564.1 hypothetical protein CN927_20290 [Bacillus cereus]